jgi:RNA polymerase sigma-70 factor, ECF subfamily
MFTNRLRKRSDEELITAGDEKALTELYERYSTSMVRYFHRMLWKDASKAQDFLHDLFLRIIERPGSFHAEKKFSTWIYSVAHNMCKNEYRKQSFRASVAHELYVGEVLEQTIDAELDHAYFRRTIDKSMEQWNEDDRTLFTLRHELEMGFAEIGSVLSVPEGTVRSRWFYLRKELAQQLHEFQTTLK